MPLISRLKLLSFAAIAGLVLCAAAPLGQAPSLRMHRAPQAPTPSTLPPPHLVGDPGTRLLRKYSGTPIDVTTYHYDASRTGWNQAETDLTPATVGSSSFGLLDTLTVDGNVFAEPLLVSNFVFPGGAKHDVLIVATGHDTVYAFDAQTYQVLWQVSLGTSQSTYDVGCYDVKPEYGISSTPVIWRTGPGSATLFVVAATEPSHDVFVSELHALNLANGKDRVAPTVISPSTKLNDGSTVTFDPKNQWSRAGLVFANGSIYVSIGSHCDHNSGNSTGWLLRYSTQLAPLSAFHTVNTHGSLELASIWMAGFAPAVDPKGDIFVATGNGDYTKNQADWGESVLKLTQKLSSVETAFTATQYNNYNNNDTDLGSGGVMLLPIAGQTPPLAVQTGKAGILYLLNQTALGGLRKDDRGALQQIDTGHGVWGGPAYYNGPAGPTVYTQGTSGFLQSWSVTTGSTPRLTAGAQGNSAGGYGGSMPIISSNGATAGTGVVWLINRANEPFSIEAYDAVNLGAPLFSAQIGTWSNAAQGNPFLTALEANGRVYAPGYKVVQVYGLTP